MDALGQVPAALHHGAEQQLAVADQDEIDRVAAGAAVVVVGAAGLLC